MGEKKQGSDSITPIPGLVVFGLGVLALASAVFTAELIDAGSDVFVGIAAILIISCLWLFPISLGLLVIWVIHGRTSSRLLEIPAMLLLSFVATVFPALIVSGLSNSPLLHSLNSLTPLPIEITLPGTLLLVLFGVMFAHRDSCRPKEAERHASPARGNGVRSAP